MLNKILLTADVLKVGRRCDASLWVTGKQFLWDQLVGAGRKNKYSSEESDMGHRDDETVAALVFFQKHLSAV